MSEYEEILDMIPQMVWKADRKETETTTLYVNKFWRNYSDSTPFDSKVIHPDDLYPCLVAWKQAETSFEFKRRLLNKNGEYNWFLTRAICDGNVWFGSCTEINQEILAETTRVALKKQNKTEKDNLQNEVAQREQQRFVAENVRIDLVDYARNLADKVTVAEKTRRALSRKAETLAVAAKLGEEERESLVSEVSTLSHEKLDITELILQMRFEKLLADKEVVKRESEKILSDQDKNELREEARKLTLEVFQQTFAGQQLKLIINSIPIILWVIDNNGTFTMSEGNGLVQIHEIPGSLVGTSIYDFYPDTEQAVIKDAMKGKNFTRTILLKQREYETFYTPMKFDSGILGVIVLARDITDQKRLEAEKSEIFIREQTAIRNAENKSVFLSNMSHEIRTPLYGMMSYVEFLLETVLTSVQRDHMETLSKNIEYLTLIVNDIIDISKLETDELNLDTESTFDPSRTIQDTCNILRFSALTKDLDLICDVSKYLPSHVKGDSNRFEQVLVNLINNAVKFTKKGSVRVNAVCDEYQKTDKQAQFTIKVIDSGIGMTNEKMNSLFDLFSQSETQSPRRTSGPGLGLYISMKLAKLMHGDISIQSQVSQGTIVTFKLTLEKAVPEPTTPLICKVLPLDGKSVLVMEDNLINQRIVKKVMTTAGAVVSCADNGLSGVDLWDKYHNFDLVLMDCQMPIMDGFQATETLRIRGCRAPIVALTANALQENIDKCLLSGMNDHISKPVKPSTLVKKVVDWTTKR